MKGGKPEVRIVALLGSPHGLRGNTGRLLRLVLNAADERGAATETIPLPGGTVLPCRACDACHTKGRCPRKDDFETIKKKITGADALVLASPNYIFNVSAQLKAFMDRCCGVIHCLGFEGKYGASVVTSGGGDERPIAEMMNRFLMTTGIVPVGSVWATMGSIRGDSFPREIADKAARLGKKLVRACREKTSFPKAEAWIAGFEERMKNLMRWRAAEWPYERDYWERRRGLK